MESGDADAGGRNEGVSYLWDASNEIEDGDAIDDREIENENEIENDENGNNDPDLENERNRRDRVIRIAEKQKQKQKKKEKKKTARRLEKEQSFRKAIKKRLLKQQDPLSFLEVRADGTRTRLKFRREEVLNWARSCVPEVKERQQDENIHQHQENLARLKGTIQKRDVRLLDPLFVQSRDPEIRVRRHSVIINLVYLRALVLHDRCLILIEDKQENNNKDNEEETTDTSEDDFEGDIIDYFLGQMEEEGEEDLNAITFSFRVFESIFDTVCELVNNEVELIEPYVHNSITSILQRTSGVTILELRQCKGDVSKLATKLQSIQEAFTNCLKSDRDMALMRLSRVNQYPQLYANDSKESQWSVDHEEMELLLETYGQQLDASIWQVIDLKDELNEGISSITLKLDSARNKLLTIELLVACVSAATGFGALFAGLFGMNLVSGVETRAGWFWGVFGLISFAVPLIVAASIYTIYKEGVLIS